jgi:hypothetical protein
VDEGAATPRDFWVFCGFSGWGAGQLQREMDERASWHVAAASAPALGELMRGAAAAWPGEAGVGAWTALVQQMGLRPSPDHLSDRLLRAWARAELLGDDRQRQERALAALARAAARRAAQGEEVGTPPGTLLRAALPSHFILRQQFLHKAVLLVLRDEGEATVAVVLNRPTANSVVFQAAPNDASDAGDAGGGAAGGGGFEEAEPPRARMLGFGGEFEGGGDTVFWLHAHPRLRAMGVGRPVGKRGGVWRCSQDEMLAALAAEPPEADESWFLAVRGFCVWPKGAAALETSARNSWRGLSLQDGGLQADIDGGAFDRLAALPADAWALMLALGEPQAAGAQRDDAGIRAWEACEKALAQPGAGGAGVEGEGPAGGGAGEEGDAADLEDLADRALREFARCFLALPASSPS